MNCILEIQGKLCESEITLCGGCVSGDVLYSAEMKLDSDSLTALLETLGSVCVETVAPFVKLLGDFDVTAKFNYSEKQTIILIQSDSMKFLGYHGQGMLVAFHISPDKLIAGDNSALADVVWGTIRYFGIKDFQFLYHNNCTVSDELCKLYQDLPQIPYNIKEDALICGRFEFQSEYGSAFTEVLSELFGIKSMDVYLGVSSKNISCALVIPDLENRIFVCRNIVLYAKFGYSGVQFSMGGSVVLNCFSGMQFNINCEFSMTNIAISASSMPTNAYTIPDTPITICNSALEISYQTGQISFGIMTQINIRNLMWYGALHLSYLGTAVTLDMIGIAMSEVSLSSLVVNLVGLSQDKVASLDIFAIKSFDLECAGKNTHIDFKNKNDQEIIAAVNLVLDGMNKEFLLENDSTTVTRMSGNQACDILNTKTMLHYWIDGTGELSFPPQAYYSAAHITVGKYNFEAGTFFCGKLVLFGYSIKIMFSALQGVGIIGFAQLSPISTKFIKITGSKSSRNTTNPVLGTATNSTLSLLSGSFRGNVTIDNPAIIYVNVSKNTCEFYIDAHFELCSVYSFDTLMYYMNKQIHISVSISYFNLITASLYIDAAYENFSNANFEFAVSLDCTGLHNKMKRLSRILDDAVKKYNDKVTDAQKKISAAQNKVSSLQNEINSYNRKIEDCKNTVSSTSKWKRWIVAFREGAKISAYEIAIVGLKVAMETAKQALNLANAVLELSKKIGSGVLNAINAVIRGVMDAFFISYAMLDIIVNGNTKLVKSEIDMWVLGKDFKVTCQCNLDTLAKSPISFLEDNVINKVKDFINGLGMGEYVYLETSEIHKYKYMNIPEDMVEAAEMAAYGASRMNDIQSMLQEISQVYIDDMNDIAPDFEDCDTEVRETSTYISYAMQSALNNMCSEGMDDLIKEVSDGIENGIFDDEELKTAQECVDTYENEIKAANSMVSEAAEKIKNTAEQIDPEYKHDYLRKARKEKEDYTGTDLMEDREYDKLYNEVEAVVMKYFPPDSGKGFFNFTDEPWFYDILNEARKDAGCAYVSSDDQETMDEIRLFKGRCNYPKTENYVPRFDFELE
jgi:hypothetical protein